MTQVVSSNERFAPRIGEDEVNEGDAELQARMQSQVDVQARPRFILDARAELVREESLWGLEI